MESYLGTPWVWTGSGILFVWPNCCSMGGARYRNNTVLTICSLKIVNCGSQPPKSSIKCQHKKPLSCNNVFTRYTWFDCKFTLIFIFSGRHWRWYFAWAEPLGMYYSDKKTKKKKKRPIHSLIYPVTPFALICIVYLLYFFFLWLANEFHAKIYFQWIFFYWMLWDKMKFSLIQ